MDLLRIEVEPDRQKLAPVQEKPKIHFVGEFACSSGNRPQILHQADRMRARFRKKSLQALIQRIPLTSAARINGEMKLDVKSVDEIGHSIERQAVQRRIQANCRVAPQWSKLRKQPRSVGMYGAPDAVEPRVRLF